MTTPQAGTAPSGWIDRSDRVRIDVRGADRAKFLHNLVTNDVKKLAEGQGCEAFITTPQGKTLAYVSLAATGTAILLRSDVGEAEVFLSHLQKYGIFEDVEIEDVSDRTFEIHAVGTTADAIASAADLGTMGEASLSNTRADWAGHPLRFIRESPTGRSGLTIVGPLDARDAVRSALPAAEEIGPARFEVMRIAAGTPVSGRDVTPTNLPQEVGRDRATISFVKGCYLGQETVARLDALGHVNKILKGVRVTGPTAPSPGAALVAPDGKPAGTITSATFAPDGEGVLALAYVRVAHATEGTALTVEVDGLPTVAMVADLPIRPSSEG